MVAPVGPKPLPQPDQHDAVDDKHTKSYVLTKDAGLVDVRVTIREPLTDRDITDLTNELMPAGLTKADKVNVRSFIAAKLTKANQSIGDELAAEKKPDAVAIPIAVRVNFSRDEMHAQFTDLELAEFLPSVAVKTIKSHAPTPPVPQSKTAAQNYAAVDKKPFVRGLDADAVLRQLGAAPVKMSAAEAAAGKKAWGLHSAKDVGDVETFLGRFMTLPHCFDKHGKPDRQYGARVEAGLNYMCKLLGTSLADFQNSKQTIVAFLQTRIAMHNAEKPAAPKKAAAPPVARAEKPRPKTTQARTTSTNHTQGDSQQWLPSQRGRR